MDRSFRKRVDAINLLTRARLIFDGGCQSVDRIDAWGEPWSSFVHPR